MTNLTLKAPPGKFRVIAVDTFTRDEDNDWVVGDYDTRDEALTVTRTEGGEMLKTHCYDDQGTHLAEGGTF